MTYTVELSRHAAREFKKLPKLVQNILKVRLTELSDNPRPLDAIKMTGYEDAYRVREGDYRIIYEVYDRNLIVLVIRVEHRKNVYRKM